MMTRVDALIIALRQSVPGSAEQRRLIATLRLIHEAMRAARRPELV